MSSEGEKKNSRGEEKSPPDALRYESYTAKDIEGLYKTLEDKIKILEELDRESTALKRLEEVGTELSDAEKYEEQMERYEEMRRTLSPEEYSEFIERCHGNQKKEENYADEPDK